MAELFRGWVLGSPGLGFEPWLPTPRSLPPSVRADVFVLRAPTYAREQEPSLTNSSGIHGGPSSTRRSSIEEPLSPFTETPDP